MAIGSQRWNKNRKGCGRSGKSLSEGLATEDILKGYCPHEENLKWYLEEKDPPKVGDIWRVWNHERPHTDYWPTNCLHWHEWSHRSHSYRLSLIHDCIHYFSVIIQITCAIEAMAWVSTGTYIQLLIHPYSCTLQPGKIFFWCRSSPPHKKLST